MTNSIIRKSKPSKIERANVIIERKKKHFTNYSENSIGDKKPLI